MNGFRRFAIEYILYIQKRAVATAQSTYMHPNSALVLYTEFRGDAASCI